MIKFTEKDAVQELNFLRNLGIDIEKGINMIIKNVQITDTFLGKEDHGIFTIILHLYGDSWGIAYGGYALDAYNQSTKKRELQGKSCEAIAEIMNVLEVASWEKLKGQYIRVQMDSEFSTINKIGHLIKENWFSFKEFYAD